MTDIKVLSAKKIFHLGFYYSRALMGKNKQRCHCETIQIMSWSITIFKAHISR